MLPIFDVLYLLLAKFFIISYVNSLERRKYVAVFFLNPVKNPVFIRAIFIPYDLTVNSFGKAFVHVRNCVDEESTWHKSNRGRTNTLTDSIRKRHKKDLI